MRAVSVLCAGLICGVAAGDDRFLASDVARSLLRRSWASWAGQSARRLSFEETILLKKRITGPWSGSADDSPSTATCPDDWILQYCNVTEQSVGRADGIIPTPTSCTAFAKGHGYGKVRARALCAPPSYDPVYISKSSGSFAQGQEVEAGCNDGDRVISCTCHSYWRQCPKTFFFESNNKCSLFVPQANNNIDKGAIVYAICEKNEQ